METPIPLTAGSPIPSSEIPAPASQAGQPAPAADLTAGSGPSLQDHEQELVSQRDKLLVLTSRVTAIQEHLTELATPENEAALEVIFDAVTKPGNRTTEFWLTLLAAVGTLSLAAAQIIPGEAAAWVMLAGTVCYTIGRLFLKGKTADMVNKTLKLLLAALVLSSLTGCAWTQAHLPQIKATASVIGNRALILAEQTLISAAVNAADAGFKADYLDAIASGLRANEGNLVTSADVASIVKIWSPNDGPQWQKLAGNAAQLADQALIEHGYVKPAAVIEQIATGFNAAAASARAASPAAAN